MPYDSSNMESVKQERSNLLHDNPVAKDASGGRPWIAKHFKSTMGSAAKMGHESPNEMGHESPNEMGHEDSPAEKALKGNQKNLNPGLRAAIEAAPEMKYGEGPEMGHDSPAEAHCMGPRMNKMDSPNPDLRPKKETPFRKEFSIEEAKKKMEERKKREKAKEEAKK